MKAHAARAAGSRPGESRVRLSLLDDERLARLVGGGSERAFAALYERYHQPLYRYCRAILRHDADAQDALQSALVSAYAALGRGQRDAPLRPWLFRIAHNEAVSQLRRRARTVELSEAADRAVQSVSDRASERERLRVLVADLAELSERQRGALVMRELSGLSHEGIALVLGTSVNAAKQAIFEARQALVDCEYGRAMACEEVLRGVSDADQRMLRSRRVRAHLRDCSGCSAFNAEIRERRSDLRLLVPPLAPAAAAGLLGRLLGAQSNHPGTGVALGAGSAGKSAGAALALKTVVAVAILTTTSVGIARALTATTTHAVPVTSQPAASRAPASRTRFAAAHAEHREPATRAVRDRRRARPRTAGTPALAASLTAGRPTPDGGAAARLLPAQTAPAADVQATPGRAIGPGGGRALAQSDQSSAGPREPHANASLVGTASAAGTGAPSSAGRSLTPDTPGTVAPSPAAGSVPRATGTGAGPPSAPAAAVSVTVSASTGTSGSTGAATPTTPLKPASRHGHGSIDTGASSTAAGPAKTRPQGSTGAAGAATPPTSADPVNAHTHGGDGVPDSSASAPTDGNTGATGAGTPSTSDGPSSAPDPRGGDAGAAIDHHRHH